MACRTINSDVGKIWICGDGLKDTLICRCCGNLAEKLCDYPLGNEKTCDSALCKDCAHHIKGDLDYCPEHSTEYGKILYSFLMEKEGGGI